MAEVYHHRTCISMCSQSTEIDKAVVLSNPFQKALKMFFVTMHATPTSQISCTCANLEALDYLFILIHLVVSCYTEYK
jgi:hypothetical protein